MSDGPEEDYIPGYQTVTDFITDGRKAVVNGIVASNRFPTGLARDKFSTYPSFARVVAYLDNTITQISEIIVNIQDGPQGVFIPDEEQRFNVLEEVNDAILERCNFKTDTIVGHLRNPGVALPPSKSQPIPAPTAYKLRDTPKPQLAFKDVVDNTDSIWKPILKQKPNCASLYTPIEIVDDEGFCVGYEHPFRREIQEYEPSKEILSDAAIKRFKSLVDVPLIIVDTKEKLDSLLSDLENAEEIAVDLEHHDRRTYQGITCLMQISTNKTDYIVDVLVLREHMHLLNGAFTNPNKLKVLHGANHDVLWLQRDFGVYLVGMFDTYQAAVDLNHGQKSLAALIQRYCSITIDKKYQRADWRQRPLPQEMIDYARMDTHYLLYIWRKMRKELIALGHGSSENLRTVFNASKSVCLQMYQKRRLHDNSYKEILLRTVGKHLNTRQDTALKRLYEWRDTIARREDESVDFILPNHMLFVLAEILPREKEGILEICQPRPALLLQYVHEIFEIITASREQIPEDKTVSIKLDTSAKKENNIALQNSTEFSRKTSHVDAKLVTTIRVPKKWDCSPIKSESKQNGADIKCKNTFKDFPMQINFS